MIGRWRGVVAVAVAGLAWGCGGQPVPEYPPLARQERQASSEQAPVRLLSVRFEYVFDEQGNWQESFEQSYRVLTHEGVEEWGGTGASWSPWYMARPVVHAQVRDAGGALRQLDPSTITESVEDPQAPEMAPKCKGKVVWFGGDRNASPVKEHVEAGGAALVRLGSQLIWWNGREESEPLSVSGWVESIQSELVEPTMAAVAAVLALGMSRSRLETFISNSE